jgi:flavin-binding protein dodecin
LVEIVGTSPVSFAEAAKEGVREASKTVRRIEWFEVTEQRGRVVDGEIREFQVTLKVGFKVER